MNTIQKINLLTWAARILALAYTLFISIFAMDVFSENIGFWNTVGALLLHLVPTFIVLALVGISWKKEWISGSAFVLLGLLYLITSWGKFDWLTYVIIAGPLVTIGILFCTSWYLKKNSF